MYRTKLRATLPAVRETIHEAAISSGRDPSSIRLVAVTKSHPVEACRAALAEGLEDLGENRVEELEEKAGALEGTGPRWHMVGHVQSRKASRVARVADLVHSVDSLRLARRISRAVVEGARSGAVTVLFQVNTSGEDAKYGFERSEAVEKVLEAASLPGLEAGGLMTMAPLTDDETVLRATFAGLREVLADIRVHHPDFGEELSMGMTNDLRIAIEEGSTMVRIGTALFGPRPR